MTDINDWYEPGDDREPDEDERWAPGVVPVSLDEVEKRLARLEPLLPAPGLVREDDKQHQADLRELVCHDVPGLIADLAAARERIAEFEALEKREEWAVTARRDVAPSKTLPLICKTPKAVDNVLKASGGVAWVRRLTVHPWEPIDTDAPF